MAETRSIERIPGNVRERLMNSSTATISSVLRKQGYGNMFLEGLAPLRPDLRMVGQAFTLRFVPTRPDLDPTGEFDNTTNKQRIAVESVGPGDLLVIDILDLGPVPQAVGDLPGQGWGYTGIFS
jgi:regulator of RNase E activity RraA